jgi:hypothetical protein
MLTDKFDAYGEAIPETGRGKREAGSASATLSRVGQYVFWLLVVVIVSARILTYPTPNFDVGSVPAPVHTVTR